MSEELEWELFDIFEAGLFAFPLYEHQTARRIIRYLMYRGVLAEEIADAIEDSTADLYIWLNRGGKNMVGEWVIAWVNDTREEYKREKIREAREGGYSWVDHEDGEGVYSDDTDDFGGGGDSGDDTCVKLVRMREESESPQPQKTNMATPQRRKRKCGIGGQMGIIRAADNISPTTDSSNSDMSEGEEEGKERGIAEVMDESPPPLPPRTHAQTHVQVHVVEPRPSLCKGLSIDTTSSDMYTDPTPDSGAVSDIYSTIPQSPPTSTTSDLIRLSNHVTSSLIGLQDTSSVIGQNNVMCSLIGLKPDDVDETGDVIGDELERDQTRDLIGFLNDVDVTMNVIGLENTSTSTCSSESHLNALNSGLPTCPNCHCKISYYHLIQRNFLIDSHSAEITTTKTDQKGSQTDNKSDRNTIFKTCDSLPAEMDQNEASGSDVIRDHVDSFKTDNNNESDDEKMENANKSEDEDRLASKNEPIDRLTNENEEMDTRTLNTQKDDKSPLLQNGQLPQTNIEDPTSPPATPRPQDNFIADIHWQSFERNHPGSRKSSDSTSKAMELNLQTLDREGPGYIFIMTDSTHNFSPWSQAQRYKIASSRHPERWLLEFRSRRIEVDLIWQVKVKHHVRAVREVHEQLERYNVQSNWYRCSLSTIMETISGVVRKYKP